MAIQKKTEIKSFTIELEENKAMLDILRVKEDNKNFITANEDNSKLEISEFYFDGNEFILTARNDEGIYVSFNIPISQEMLVDFMTYNIKKMNKMKTVLENLN